MKEAEPDSQFPACPHCGLKGARCCPVRFHFSEDDGGLLPGGFDIECAFCRAGTETQPTEARAIDMWNYGMGAFTGRTRVRTPQANGGLAWRTATGSAPIIPTPAQEARRGSAGILSP